DGSYTNRPWLRAAFAAPGPGVNLWNSPPRGREGLGSAARGYHRRRSQYRLVVDAPLAAETGPGPPAPRHAVGPQHHRPVVACGGLLAADEPQAAGGSGRPRPRSAVPLSGSPPPTLPEAWLAGDQRGYPEEGTDRPLQEPRQDLAADPPVRARPRLPQCRPGEGRAIRNL